VVDFEYAAPQHDRNIALAGHSTNLLGVPTALVAGADFNEHPFELHIHGTRETNAGLFDKLAGARTVAEAGVLFQDYMSLVFGFEDEQRLKTDALGRRRFRSSYLSLLQDWGFDSNNAQSAVLKGWVESRFGLLPTYHKAPISGFTTRAWMEYIQDKMNSRYHNNCIYLQLDLLYEFCQWAAKRFNVPAGSHMTLYRGVNRLTEDCVREKSDGHHMTLRLNNIVSFTDRRSRASEFGDYIIEAKVPVVKLLFFNELLPRHALRGESEYLVIGGSYRVRVSY
jgi:NAD+--dinitrogen-reductase ADP-D-ribosyltransferase